VTAPDLTAAANLHRLIAEVHADVTLTPAERFAACAPLLEAENRALGVGAQRPNVRPGAHHECTCLQCCNARTVQRSAEGQKGDE
jgi:hypothetical protein